MGAAIGRADGRQGGHARRRRRRNPVSVSVKGGVYIYIYMYIAVWPHLQDKQRSGLCTLP